MGYPAEARAYELAARQYGRRWALPPWTLSADQMQAAARANARQRHAAPGIQQAFSQALINEPQRIEPLVRAVAWLQFLLINGPDTRASTRCSLSDPQDSAGRGCMRWSSGVADADVAFLVRCAQRVLSREQARDIGVDSFFDRSREAVRGSDWCQAIPGVSRQRAAVLLQRLRDLPQIKREAAAWMKRQTARISRAIASARVERREYSERAAEEAAELAARLEPSLTSASSVDFGTVSFGPALRVPGGGRRGPSREEALVADDDAGNAGLWMLGFGAAALLAYLLLRKKG